MRNYLFQALAISGDSIINSLLFVSEILCSFITGIFRVIIFVVANISKFCLYIVDKNRLETIQASNDQSEILTEFQVLAMVEKVKQDAIANDWTNQHSMAIQQLSARLYHECEWPLHKIHSYMKSIVESIPGLSYISGDEAEE